MFGTSGIRGPVGDEVTAELALAVGRAVGSTADQVVIGRDPRESGKFLADALSAGCRECGADVVRLGLAATPTIARSVAWQDADAGVSITASHNPPADNGIKLWTPSGQAFDERRRTNVVDRIEAERYTLQPWDGCGREETWADAGTRHVEALVSSVDVDEPLDVAVDLGTGAGSVTVEALQRLGCRVETLNAQPDGSFPGRPSEPTTEHCTSLRALVANTDAQVGIAHDGDADRMLAVDETGAFVPADALLTLFAKATATVGDLVAAPLNTSLLLDDALEAIGASVTRTRVGDVFVAERAAEPDVAFGGEPSGAWIWPNRALCPDGSLAACKLVALVAERGPLSTLVAEVGSYPIRRKSVEVSDKAGVMEAVERTVRETYDDVETTDGVRVARDEGWFLIRASGTQPLVRITAEARSTEGAEELFETAIALVRESTT